MPLLFCLFPAITLFIKRIIRAHDCGQWSSPSVGSTLQIIYILTWVWLHWCSRQLLEQTSGKAKCRRSAQSVRAKCLGGKSQRFSLLGKHSGAGRSCHLSRPCWQQVGLREDPTGGQEKHMLPFASGCILRRTFREQD